MPTRSGSKLNAPNDPALKLVLVGLGSNLDPEKNIAAALDLLDEHTSLIERSSIWQTPAVGSSGPDYLNASALIETDLGSGELKSAILGRIETELGRVRMTDKFADRTIDLDVLVYDGKVVDPELWTQAHIAVPAAEILPRLVNPLTGESLSQAADRLLPGTGILKRPDLA